MEILAQKPYATSALFLIAMIESSLLPVAPDLLFVPLSVLRPRRSLMYAAVCVLGSVGGAVLGYVIGYGVFETVGKTIIVAFGWTESFATVVQKYNAHAWSVLLLAGFTPVPFQLFTIAAGFGNAVGFTVFVLVTNVGCSIRFFLFGVLFFFFGPVIQCYGSKYLGRAMAIVVLLMVIWYAATKTLFSL